MVDDSHIEDPYVTNPDEAKVVVDLENAMSVFDCIGGCKFMGLLFMADDFTDLISAATGWDFSVEEFRKSGERVVNLSRAYCIREGISRADDVLPTRLMEDPLPGGSAEGMVVEKDLFEGLKDAYYACRGWDKENGYPTKAKLEELDLADLLNDINAG